MVLGGLRDFSCLTREHGPQQWESQILTTRPPGRSLRLSVCTHMVFPPFSHFVILSLLCYVSSTSVKVLSLFYMYMCKDLWSVFSYLTVFILVFTPYCSLIFLYIERGYLVFFFFLEGWPKSSISLKFKLITIRCKQSAYFMSSVKSCLTDGDCGHEIKRRLVLGRKVMANLVAYSKAETLLCQQRSI